MNSATPHSGLAEAARPIGVFDSGIGGLTVVSALRALLPNESIYYLGDTARLPYGGKSETTVQRYSLEIAALLLEEKAKTVVVACNTASALALPQLEKSLPVTVTGVILPGARAAIAKTRTGHVGVIGTRATIKSGAYERALHSLNPDVQVTARPCPLLGILTGVVAAWRRGTLLDSGSLSLSLIFYSLPTQWLGLMLVILFAGTLPISGIGDPFIAFTDPTWWETLKDRLTHMILPSATLGIVLYGSYALIVRSAMLETLGEDYILTARAKGLRNWTIVWRHAFRNALLPVATLMAISLGYVVAGAILVEAVFSYPGIGLETYDAVFAKDYPIVQGAFLLLTLSVVLANYIADLLYFKLDPRITT